MKLQQMTLVLVLSVINIHIFCQDYIITKPSVEFNGEQLTIVYDIVSKKASDIYYIKPEIRNLEGIPLRAKSFSGALGEDISRGKEHTILWIPAQDNLYLNEDVTVEILGEKYEKTYNKGSAILLSSVIPGLGQRKAGKWPHMWLISIPIYGAIGTGIVYHQYSLDSYYNYQIETNPIQRDKLWETSQKQQTISRSLLFTAVSLWAANLIWIAATPNSYKPLKLSMSVSPTIPHQPPTTVLSLNVDF